MLGPTPASAKAPPHGESLRCIRRTDVAAVESVCRANKRLAAVRVELYVQKAEATVVLRFFRQTQICFLPRFLPVP